MSARLPPNFRYHAAARQRGAVAVFAAIAIIALLAALAMAIDVGRLYVAQKKLDSAADMAALAGAEAASGCKGLDSDGTPGTLADVRDTVRQALEANGGSLAWMTGFRSSPAVEIGRVSSNRQGVRTFSPLTAGHRQADSVRVNLTSPMPGRLIPFTGSSTGTLVSSSTARQSVVGSFSVGSSLINLNTGNSAVLNSLLGGLLGGNINLSVADYQALANVGVSIDALATAVNVDAKDFSDLLEANALTPLLPDVIDGLVSGLGSGASTQVAQLLRNLAAAAQNKDVPFSDVLVPVSDVATSVPFVNLLDLIVALGAAASADSATPIQLPVGVTIPGVLTAIVHIQILEPPQIGFGRPGEAYAKTAAARVTVRIDGGPVMTALSGAVNGALNGLVSTLTTLLRAVTLGLINITTTLTIPSTLKLGVDVNVAQAEARLDSVHCPSRSAPDLTAGLSASTALAHIQVGGYTGTPTTSFVPALDATQNFNLVSLALSARALFLNLGTLNLDAVLGMSCASIGTSCTPGMPAPAAFNPLPRLVDRFSRVQLTSSDSYELALGHLGDSPLPPINPQSVGSNLNLGLDVNVQTQTSNATGALGGLGSALSGLINTIVSTLTPLTNFVGSVLSTVVSPLLNLLGIQLGGATVYMNTVSVDQPLIVTRCIPGSAAPYGCPED